jgi:hypothetical protein
MQVTLGYSPVKSGVALLPMVAVTGVMANVGNIVLMPRLGPKPLLITGMLCNAAGMAWLTRIGVHSGYASALLGPVIVAGTGMGAIICGALLRPGPLTGPEDIPARMPSLQAAPARS